LFRRFPHDVPADTWALYWKKVLSHYLQAPNQPCLFYDATAKTHILSPCEHVICDHCFDGSSYSACPVCEHHVDLSSPFFLVSPVLDVPKERVTFRRLDLGDDEAAATRAFFVSLCERKQALSPDDREALVVIVRERGAEVLSWLPAKIPVRENVAIVFGTLFQTCDPDVVLPVARRYMTTATDVLRFIAVLSGTDGSLQAETIFKKIDTVQDAPRFLDKIAALLGVRPHGPRTTKVSIPIRVKRFKVVRLRRPLRRALLSLLEGFDSLTRGEPPSSVRRVPSREGLGTLPGFPSQLTEDMLRHRSYWVWVGEFLHPTEYAARFPNVARAFEVVRRYAPDGQAAPAFHGWGSQLERAIAAKDVSAMVSVLRARPGELARRFDRALRVAGSEPAAVDAVIAAFTDNVTKFATPVLVTLRSHLTTRAEKASVRVYWPKGRVAKGVSSPDERAPLAQSAIDRVTAALDSELLRRFSQKPAFEVGLVDDALRNIVVPFNERTASAAAVILPRGSRIPVPTGKTVRLFLHWCQPEKGGRTTDLDLSVGFYDQAWNHIDVCSYYKLEATGTDGATIAKSAGDLRDGPWPDGATEFVDVDCAAALASGVRYAVMVVNAYAGMPFSQLERAFAGVMLRDDAEGRHFDPRTVELKFSLAGDNGIFLPLLLDVRERVLH
ncbi:MAG TPA: RING finger family 4 domain-containing protein, partial [Polyangia bacterium]|nr:RING finger family 4 domain-containing protein [Polyangia bacterium]